VTIYVQISAIFCNLLIYVFFIRFTYIHSTQRLDEDRLTSGFL